jgi:hypothetical protein
MEIRLAFHQGLLSEKSLNKFQYYAMSYWLGMDRRDKVRDINETLEKQVWYLDPERFDELFMVPTFDADGQVYIGGQPTEEVVQDIDEIDKYFDSLDEKKSMTGAQLFRYLGDADEQGWV